MTTPTEWAFPEEVRPRQENVSFNLESALRSVVLLRSEVPEDASTAEVLGTERRGNGIAIRVAGRVVILTIGYLVTEAQSIWLTTNDGRSVPGYTLAVDHVTGLGVVL